MLPRALTRFLFAAGRDLALNCSLPSSAGWEVGGNNGPSPRSPAPRPPSPQPACRPSDLVARCLSRIAGAGGDRTAGHRGSMALLAVRLVLLLLAGDLAGNAHRSTGLVGQDGVGGGAEEYQRVGLAPWLPTPGSRPPGGPRRTRYWRFPPPAVV